MNSTPSGFPDFLPDDIPEAVLFLVAGIDYAALGRVQGGDPVGVQVTINCAPGLVVAALRATADSIAAAAEADREQARRN